MSEPLLRIRNRHILTCGDPPIVNGDDPDLYIGYFQNTYGEQWLFTYHRTSREAELRGGDMGWNTPITVADGKATGVILSADESAWLQACWAASTGVSPSSSGFASALLMIAGSRLPDADKAEAVKRLLRGNGGLGGH